MVSETLEVMIMNEPLFYLTTRLFCLHMPKKKNFIRLKASNYFPKTVRAIGALFCIFGLAMVWTSPIIGLLFLFITAVTITTHYGFEVNTAPNSFREYVWVLGWKDGKVAPFKSIEFLFIQQGQYTFLTIGLKEKTLPAYEAYVKFEARNEVHFLTDTSKERLIGKIMAVAQFIQVEIKDYSAGQPIIVFTP